MVLALINSVQAQGSYWIAVSFIWGWLLFPIMSLGEVIKKEVALGAINLRYYVRITTLIVLVWLLCYPLYGCFFEYVLHIGDNYDEVMTVINISLPFYCVFAYGSIFSSIFYGTGKVQFVLYQSLVVNACVYGTAFTLYKIHIYIPTLTNITYLFSCSLLLGSLINAVLFYRKRRYLYGNWAI